MEHLLTEISAKSALIGYSISIPVDANVIIIIFNIISLCKKSA